MLQLSPRFFAAPVAAFCAIGLLSFQGHGQAAKQDDKAVIQIKADCAPGAKACTAKDR